MTRPEHLTSYTVAVFERARRQYEIAAAVWISPPGPPGSLVWRECLAEAQAYAAHDGGLRVLEVNGRPV